MLKLKKATKRLKKIRKTKSKKLIENPFNFYNQQNLIKKINLNIKI